MSRYPDRPGHRGTMETGTAGSDHFAPKLAARHREVLDDIATHGPSTGDEVAARTGRLFHLTRPRLSELRLKGLLIDTGERRSTGTGGKSWVARIATAEEIAAHLAAKENAQ